jgi:hypothetical protein
VPFWIHRIKIFQSEFHGDGNISRSAGEIQEPGLILRMTMVMEAWIQIRCPQTPGDAAPGKICGIRQRIDPRYRWQIKESIVSCECLPQESIVLSPFHRFMHSLRTPQYSLHSTNPVIVLDWFRGQNAQDQNNHASGQW